MGNSNPKPTKKGESSNYYKTPSTREKNLNSNLPTGLHNTVEDKKDFKFLPNRNQSKNISIDLTIDPDASSAKIIKRDKKQEDIDLIKRSLSTHYLFSYIPEESLEVIVIEMKLYSLQAKEVIYKQGNFGDKLFILAKGTLEVDIDGSIKSTLHPGAMFGELALIHNLKHTETIRTKEKTLMWGIDRKAFKGTLSTLNAIKYLESKKFLEGHPLFSSLEKNQINLLLSMMVTQYFSHGQRIFDDEDPGELFYMIQEGQAECSTKGNIIQTLSAGDYFDEQAFLGKTHKTVTVKAINHLKVLSIGKDLLAEVMGEQFECFLYKNSLRIAIESSNFLKDLKKPTQEELISKFEIFSFRKGELAIPAGAMKNRYIWMVLKGKIKSDKGKTLEKSQNLGVKWFFNGTEGIVSQNYFALEDSVIGMIRKDVFSKIVPVEPDNNIQEKFVFAILKQVDLFRTINESKLFQLARAVKLLEFQENQKIFSQGDLGESFYIIKEGEIEIIKDKKVIRTMCKGNFFGERSILLNENRTATAISKTKSFLLMITKDDFLSIIDEKILQLLVKRIYLQDDMTELSDLSIIQHIGKGSFGSVYLCINKTTQFLYALKIVERQRVNSYQLQQRIKLERDVIQQLDHQFIVKFVKTFKDSDRVYFLLEYVQGITFFKALRIFNAIDFVKCRFYASCLVLILEHLHKNAIVFRDLKPENLIIEPDGYIKLLDFGTAKIIHSRTYSVVGTPHYMAPEVILGKGYLFSADIWSLGVIVYEMLCGYLPFADDWERDPLKVYKQVVIGKVKYPDFINPISKAFIKDVFSKDISKRSDAKILRSHEFFGGNDWEGYLNRTIASPYKPTCENFDDYAKFCDNKDRSLENFFKRTQEKICIGECRNPSQLISNDWDIDF